MHNITIYISLQSLRTHAYVYRRFYLTLSFLYHNVHQLIKPDLVVFAAIQIAFHEYRCLQEVITSEDLARRVTLLKYKLVWHRLLVCFVRHYVWLQVAFVTMTIGRLVSSSRRTWESRDSVLPVPIGLSPRLLLSERKNSGLSIDIRRMR